MNFNILQALLYIMYINDQFLKQYNFTAMINTGNVLEILILLKEQF